jgi:predicted transcriptional regulator
MANNTYSIHTSEENIRSVDQHAERLRRSRNWIINEAIEMWLNHYDADLVKAINDKSRPKRKAGAR